VIKVDRVDGRRGVAEFVDVAWIAQAGRNSPWIPPLRTVVRDLLDRKRNPFYGGADRALFSARRGGVPVGRIAAIENRWHTDHHGDRTGFFGFFECLDDPDAAAGLFGAAENWLRARGLETVRGPVSPSMNHESGLLVSGFEHAPVMMTPWNPPYYASLVEASGFEKGKDLLAYWIPAGDKLAVPDRVARLAERTRQRSGITFRELDLRALESEARKVLHLYHQAWEGNWGFVPPGWDEFWHTAKELKAVLAENFSFVAEADGEVVGFMMIARDVNAVLADIPSGRLWPWNIAKLLRGIPKVMRGRIVLLGLTTAFRNRGIFPLFAHEAARRALELGAEGAEASWILEDNQALVGPLDAMGLEAYKRWRVYEKALGAR
jgi:hypothetical protein